MATSGNNRDVRLGVNVETTGRENLQGLAGDLRGIGGAAEASAADAAKLSAALTEQQAATKALRDTEREAKAEQTAARAALDAQRDALARVRAESTAAARATDEWQAQERALKLAIVEARTALREKTQATQAAAAAARDSVAAEQRMREELARVQAAHREAARAAKEQGAATREAFGTIETQLSTIRNAVLALTGSSLVGSLAKDVADVADGFANLKARIGLVTNGSDEARAALEGVFAIAQRTGTAVDDVGALYVKLAQSGRELGLTNAQALRLTESIGQAAQLSGATAQEANAAVTQLGQALASGVLQGDELRSLLENAPRLARAMADGLGVSVGALKELGSTGALTAQQVVSALQGQAAALQREYDALPPTVGRALTNLSTAWTQYIGQADAATGASKTAAGVIDALARNLDTVGAALWSAGKAAAAYSTVRLAQSFVDQATAARAATAAIEANAAATAAGAAGAGRLASILSTLKLGAVVTILANVKELGTEIGEAAAKLVGFRDRSAEIEATARADAEAARAWAQQTAALAQAQQQAADAALGLTKQSRALVAEFDGAIAKGDTLAEALGKIAKAADLGSVKGIETFGTALDALGQRGKLTGLQIRDALADALKGADLATFETQARAAFDSSEQGARRLAAALDAIANESLRRAGTSIEELQTGFNKASTSAINDVDALARTLDAIGAKGEDAGRALVKALDTATAAASTERALKAVEDRVKALGESGALTGEQVADALDKIKRKADDLQPGINSLGEALRAFGLKTREELQATADKLGAAWQQISTAAGVSIADQVKAFEQYRAAAIAANGGVESSTVALQRRMLELRANAAGLGDAFTQAMDKARAATDLQTSALDRLIATQKRLDQLTGASTESGLGTLGTGSGSSAAGAGTDPNKYDRGSVETRGGSQMVPPAGDGWTFVNDMRIASNDPRTGAVVYGYWLNSKTGQTVAAGDAINSSGLQVGTPAPGGGTLNTPSTGPGQTLKTGSSAAGKTVTVNLNVAGQQSIPVMATEADAEALIRALEAAKRAAGV